MKHYLLALSIGTAFLVGCQSPQKQNLIDSNFAFAEQQLKYAFPKIDEARANESQESKEKRIAKQWGELTNPRNTEPDGSLRLVPSKDWTSGFFPGELWYVYEYTHFLERESREAYRNAGTRKEERHYPRHGIQDVLQLRQWLSPDR